MQQWQVRCGCRSACAVMAWCMALGCRTGVTHLSAIAGGGSGYRPPRLHSRASVDNAYLDTALEGPAVPASGVPAQQAVDAVSPNIPAASTDPLAAGGGNSGDRSGGASGSCARRLSERSWLQAAHYATLRGFVEQHLLQRMLAAVSVLEWPLTVARRGTIPLLEQVPTNSGS